MFPEITIDPDAVPYIRICKGCDLPFGPRQHNQTRCRPGCSVPDRHKARIDPLVKPFLAIDGEGGGTNQHGQQNYLLMCARGVDDASLHQLFSDNRRLTTVECLDFILALPVEAIICGFYFDYDVTQILRDLPVNRLARLLSEFNQGGRLSPFTEWQAPNGKSYLLQYVPKQVFRVGLAGVKGSMRTINETGGFFQAAFAKVIDQWQVVDAETAALIARNKLARPDFAAITPEIRRYCETECRLLAEVMHKLRDRFIDGTEQVRHLGGLSLVPRAWRGAGYVAARLLESSETPRTADLPSVPAKFGNMIIEAYYGGHFEIDRTGYIKQPVWEHDINSAYPAAMPHLPCAIHTRWEKVARPGPGLYCADIEFSHPATNLWAGFPFRTAQGHLCWPLAGSGVYWSPEIEAARLLEAKVKFREIWQAVKCCDCQPYAFVEPLYEFRRSLGKGNEGYPIKLGLNAMYGKLAQRKGAHRYYNLIHAGLITAITRAKLLQAVALNPKAVMMQATDAVYSLEPLPLEIGEQLGQWECKQHPDMFIVQPGLYWFPSAPVSERSHKTRGIPRGTMQQHSDLFRQHWQRFANVGWLYPKIDHCPDEYAVPLPLNTFIGIKLAMQRNEPNLAGCWLSVKKDVSFDWSNKRGVGTWSANYEYIQHAPLIGDIRVRSHPYDPKKLSELEKLKAEFDPS